MRPKRNVDMLVGSFASAIKWGIAIASSRMARSSPAFTRWNVVRVMAIGVLMSAGTAIYFDLVSEGEASAPNAKQYQEAASSKDAPIYRGAPIDDDEWRFGPPYLEDFQSASVPPASGKGIVVYPGDDEWVYWPPYLEVFPEDDPYAYLTLEQFIKKTGHSYIHGMEIGILSEDDPYAYLTIEQFGRQVKQ